MAELTPEQIKLEQERLDLLQNQNEAVKNLAAAYSALGKIKGKLSDSDKEAINLAKVLSGISKDIESSINKRLSGSSSVKDLSKQLNQLEQNKIQLANKSAAIDQKINNDKAAAAARIAQLNRAELTAIGRRTALENKAMDLEADREAAKAAGDTNEVKRLSRLIKDTDHQIKLKQKGIDAVVKEKEAQKELVKQLDKEKEAHEQIKKQLDEEITLIEEAKKQKQQEETLDVLKEKFRVKEIKEMFTIAGLLKIILDTALKFNEVSVNIGKNLGYGADNADRVTTDIKQIALGSSNLNVTLANAAEAMGQLNEATGGVAEYSADTLETQIMLTKQFGLSGDEAAGLYKFSVLTGKAASQINDEMVGAFAATRNSVKGSANFKTTMVEVSKISGQLAANFKNNPAELTKAVVQAQALGTTLEKAKEQGSALLNFESSIEDELKAELLTGQQMNLERARAAALQGDQVTVMKELANQGMTLEKFQGMNVIAQESFAKALGLSADGLADQLNKQKIAQEQGKSLAEITKEEALEAEKRQNIQEKFNAAILKLQDFIGNLVSGPVGQLLEALMKIADIVSMVISPIFSTIGIAIDYMVEGLKVVGTVLGVIGGIMAVLNMKMFAMAALEIVKGAWSALGGIPFIGPALAVGTSLAAIGAIKKYTVGDMLSPADGKTQVSTKEGGLFELSPNDDLVAGPGIANKVTSKNIEIDENSTLASSSKSPSLNKEKSISPNIDLTPMIAAINEVRNAVDKLYTKDTSINMDGKKVGTTLSQNSYKSA